MRNYMNEKLKRLANRLHTKFHIVIYGKKPNHKADYYDSYVAYFDKRLDDLEKATKGKKIDIERIQELKELWDKGEINTDDLFEDLLGSEEELLSGKEKEQ